jgi:hypothetical protein
MNKLPENADDLIDELDKAFPLINFPVTTPAHIIQRELGKRDVIDFLRAMQRDRAERAVEEFGGDGGSDDVGQWSTR